MLLTVTVLEILVIFTLKATVTPRPCTGKWGEYLDICVENYMHWNNLHTLENLSVLRLW